MFAQIGSLGWPELVIILIIIGILFFVGRSRGVSSQESIRYIFWLITILAYVFLIREFGFLFFVFLASIMGISYWSFTKDELREIKNSDDFNGSNLFFRYGTQIRITDFSIPVDTSWSEDKVFQFSISMLEHIKSQVSQRLESASLIEASKLTIEDRKLRADNKVFLKLGFSSTRGSKLTHFVHYAIIGKSIVAHYFTYVRGTYNLKDVINFVIFSPFTIWFWGIPFYRNNHSIISSISKHIDNSFDLIDLSTFFESSYYALLNETRLYLQDNDLLSEELAQIIVNNINNTSQNVSVNNSSNISLGDISNLGQRGNK